MAVKSLSTRAQICGRSAKCHGGHSAVEQSSYISRTTIYSEYDGQTYYPKYSEDLVHTEVMLPENAPAEYSDPAVLWNSVEMAEQNNSRAQLARTYRVELPNEWSYELAIEVMRDYIERNFVCKGMCAQFAIHDSENKETGQRNLHCHILLTMRGIDEQGQWMPKQKKVYLTDEQGERIPLIDKKTGQQKVDKQNRKQWKCKTVDTNDWNNRENAKIWRRDLADTINAVNQRIGETENFWEHRSFKEQGLDIEPQIHLGEKASAMERAGIHTIRGDINRRILANNAVIEQARATYIHAKNALDAIKEKSQTVIQSVKNEILDMIREVAKRRADRLAFPVMKGKYLRLISNRSKLQSREYMEGFVQKFGLTTFEELKKLKAENEVKFDILSADRMKQAERIDYLERLLAEYKDYEPYKQINDERWKLKGFARKQFEKKHALDIAYYDTYRERLKGMITESDKKIIPKAWQRELDSLLPKYEAGKESYAIVVSTLATIEVLEYNKTDLDRMLENERKENMLLRKQEWGAI